MNKYLNILLVAGAVAALVMLYFVSPTDQSLTPKCLIKALTGYNCPGCGFQRAVHAALHGRFAEAVRFNYFLLLGLPYLFSVFLSDVVLRGEARRRMQRVTHSRWLLLGFVGATIAWWIGRNVLGV